MQPRQPFYRGTFAEQSPTRAKIPETYGTDRRCRCSAILSRYNPGPLCAPCANTQREAQLKRDREVFAAAEALRAGYQPYGSNDEMTVEDAILATLAAAGGWLDRIELEAALPCARTSIWTTLRRLEKHGRIEMEGSTRDRRLRLRERVAA